MPEDITLENLSNKIDGLIHSMGLGFNRVDQRFNVMDGQFDEMNQKFISIDQRFDTISEKFDSIDKRFNSVDQKFDLVNNRFNIMDQRFDTMDLRFSTSDKRMDSFDDKLNSLFATTDDLARITKEGFDRITEDVCFLKQEVAFNGDAIVKLSNKLEMKMAAVHLHLTRLDEHVGLFA